MRRLDRYPGAELEGEALTSERGRRVNGCPPRPDTILYRKNLLHPAPINGDIMVLDFHPTLPTPDSGTARLVTLNQLDPRAVLKRRAAAQLAAKK